METGRDESSRRVHAGSLAGQQTKGRIHALFGIAPHTSGIK